MPDSGEDTGLRGAPADEAAFVELLRRHRPMLARYIRACVGHPDDADDVLQETLVAAWVGLPRLRDPARARAWLLQVARNRCRDYRRTAERRDVPTEESALLDRANRFGLHQHGRQDGHGRVVADIITALDSVPEAQREAAMRFYLEGMTVAEIAAQTQAPAGTIKRRLFQARRSLRQALGVPPSERGSAMKDESMKDERMDDQTPAPAAHAPAFPAQRPAIVIAESDGPPFSIDCPELRCWSIIPRVGERASWANYHPPEWSLVDAVELHAVRPARVHDVDGVEIDVQDIAWKAGTGRPAPWTMYGRLTETKAQYLATVRQHAGITHVRTFLDDGFAWDWGEMDRRLESRPDVAGEPDERPRVDGPFTVGIGAEAFACMRVLEGSPTDVRVPLTASYLTREGRTVLVRHYCQPGFVDSAEFEVVVDAAERLVVDGVTFVHWYDTLTGVAL